MTNRRFPKADTTAAADLYELGRGKLSRMLFLTSAELRQSLELAALAHQTGFGVNALANKIILCGQKRPRKRSARKEKRFKAKMLVKRK